MRSIVITSAGFIVYSNGKYLLCHTCVPGYRISHKDNRWTISKGEVEATELPLEAACRELLEETGIEVATVQGVRVSSDPIARYEIPKSKKQVIAYLLVDKSGALMLKGLKCASIIKDGTQPELDDFYWASPEEAKEMVFKSQKHLFEGEVLKNIETFIKGC